MIVDYMRPPRLPGSMSLQKVFISLLDNITDIHLSGRYIGNLHLNSFRIKDEMQDKKLDISLTSSSSYHEYFARAFEPLRFSEEEAKTEFSAADDLESFAYIALSFVDKAFFEWDHLSSGLVNSDEVKEILARITERKRQLEQSVNPRKKAIVEFINTARGITNYEQSTI